MTHSGRKPDQPFAQERVHTPDPAASKPVPDAAMQQHLDYDLRALTVHDLDHYVASAGIDRRFHIHG